jgi:hypothetical protein
MVPIFVSIEDGLGFDDLRIIEVETLYFFGGVITEGVGDCFVTNGYGYLRISICCLHRFSFLVWVMPPVATLLIGPE